MKKLILSMACVIASTIVIAQTQRGNIMIGGNIANLDLNLGSAGTFSLNIEPRVAWFVQDQLALGGYSMIGLTTTSGVGTSLNYGFGGLGRYYSGSRAIDNVPRTRLFGELTLGIDGFNPVAGGSTNGLAVGLGPGLAYFVTPNVGLETLLRLRHISGFGTAPTNTSLNLNVGLQIYLSRGAARQAVQNVAN